MYLALMEKYVNKQPFISYMNYLTWLLRMNKYLADCVVHSFNTLDKTILSQSHWEIVIFLPPHRTLVEHVFDQSVPKII